MLIVIMWNSTSSNVNWVQVVCMSFMCYLISYYFNDKVLDHDE